MSARKIMREQQKLAYKKFCGSWAKEKAYQRYVVEELQQDLPTDQPRLKRKPTFSQWLEMHAQLKVRMAAKQAEELALANTAVEAEPDLEWEE